MTQTKVAVIGGGLAGITAAIACADAGQSVTLFEARAHLGGRVSSVQHPRQGVPIDNCQHACFRVYSRFLQLIGRCDAQDSFRLQERTILPFALPDSGQFAELTTGKLSPPNHMLGSMLKFPFLSLKDKIRMNKAVKAIAKMTDEDIWSIDSISFVDWLNNHGQTKQSIDRFWGFFVLAALNIPIEQASAAQACMLFRNGLFGDADAFDVGIFTSDLTQSLDPLFTKAMQQAGIEIQMSTNVKRIICNESEGLQAIETANGQVEFDKVIIATPHRIAKRLLTSIEGDNQNESLKQLCDNLGKLDYSALIGLHAFYDGERVPNSMKFATILDEPVIQMIFNKNTELDEESPIGKQWLSVPISGANEFMKMSDEEILEEFDRVLLALWPKGAEVKRIEHLIVKTPKATFAPTPDSAKLRPGADAVSDSVILAGDWTMTEWPSTMEGAVRSGLKAAAVSLGKEYNPNDDWSTWPSAPKRGEKSWRTW